MSDRYEIHLASGATIQLHVLFEHYTYAGLMDGLPTRRLNKTLVESALISAREKLWLDAEPYLIPPLEASLGLPEADWVVPLEEFEPVRLPEVTCLATFESTTPARDPKADMSSLTIVWFQEELALPIDPGVVERIRAIDWRSHAKDGYY